MEEYCAFVEFNGRGKVRDVGHGFDSVGETNLLVMQINGVERDFVRSWALEGVVMMVT